MIRLDRSRVLTQMLRPRIDDEGLDVPVQRLRVAEDAPARRAIAPPQPTQAMRRMNEGGAALGIDPVLNRDQYRTIVRANLESRDGRRRRPMIPSGQIDVDVGEWREEAEQDRGGGPRGCHKKGKREAFILRRQPPDDAAERHAALKHEQEHRQYASAYPGWSQLLR